MVTLRRPSDGLSWGTNANGQLGDGTRTARTSAQLVPGLGNVSALAVGSNYSLAVSNGNVRE